MGLSASVVGVVLVGLLDWSTGSEISLSILYLLPIGLAVWFAGRTTGIVVSCVAAAVWITVDLRGGAVYSHPLIPYWNAVVRLGFFLLTTFLLERLRFLNRHLDALVRERTAALVAEVAQRAEAETRSAMLAQALESTAELICLTDLEARFTFVNRAFREALGYRETELLGRTPELLYSPNNPPTLFAEVLQQSRCGGWQGEMLDRRKDGTEFPIYLSTSQIKDPSGQVVGLIGVSRDITERKQAEKQSAVFGSLGHKLSAAATPEDAAQSIMEMASELFGWDAGYLHLYSPEEDLIVPILTVDTVNGQRTPVPPSSFTLDPSPLMRRVMAAGAQMINRMPDALPAVPLVPFGDAGRSSASMMYVSIHSSSTVLGVLSIQSYAPAAYTQNDLRLLQALADHCGDALQRIKLAAATRELAAIVENSSDAIITKSPDGTILSWNQGAERLYGYTAGEIKGRSLAVLVPPEQHRDLPAVLERFSRGERMSDFETTRLRKDGARIELSVNISPIRDAAGHVTGTFVIERDITARKRLEREIADISQHEQQRLAHELHDHLGAYLTGIAFRMKALAEALDRHALPEADAARELVKLVNAGTDQVRNFARLIAPVQIANGGLAVALSRLGAEMETLFGIVCRVEVAPDLPLLTDEQALQLYRIAQEAARNAVQHGKARRIEISVRHESGQLVQTIRNDGQVWDPAKESANSLGLRIMRYRANTLGGTLALQSETEGRTAVICQLPLSPTGPSDPAVDQPALPFL